MTNLVAVLVVVAVVAFCVVGTILAIDAMWRGLKAIARVLKAIDKLWSHVNAAIDAGNKMNKALDQLVNKSEGTK